MTTTVRRAVPTDLPVLLELVAEYCQADEHVFDEHVVRGGLEPLLIDDTFGAIWMIDPEPDTADGYIVVTWGWSIEIGGLDVVLDEFYVRSRVKARAVTHWA